MSSAPPIRVPIVKAKVEAAPGQRVDWNAVPAPTGYVPGLGRGATGFTTRSDIGPARPGAGPGGGEQQEGEVDDSKFDEFMGNDAGAFAGGIYDQDDKEADQIWDAVDQFMDERRRERREKRLKEEIEKYRAENPKITEQFADLKRKLTEVSRDEWEAIPDIGDYTIKKRQREMFIPAPDTLIGQALKEKQVSRSVNDSGLSGLTTPGPMAGTLSTAGDLTSVGAGRNKMIELKLDKMADDVSGQTVVDPKGYLTDMKSIAIKSETDIADIKKARLLLKSVIQTNPHHAPGWVAIARLEELAGSLAEARKLLQEACEKCPKSEDVWLETSRLYAKQSRDNAKAVLARGVAQIPDSVKLWMAAAALETDKAAQLRVLKKALERIPYSVSLWKAAIELVDEDDAKVMLDRAVECCPNQVDLWLALAKLESYDNAKKVLNKARKALPAEQLIWITAAQLEEANGNIGMVEKIISKALKALEGNGVVINRETWLGFAENAEKSGMAHTARALTRCIARYHIDKQDEEATLVADAEEYLKKSPPCVEVARTLYSIALESYPKKEDIWRAAAHLEMTHGTNEQVHELLKAAVANCPQAEVLWLMAAKHMWRVVGDIAQSRQILASGFIANPDSEQIWLAAFKLEFENDEKARAKVLLDKARTGSGAQYPRVWMKSAIVERQLAFENHLETSTEERKLLNEAIERFPGFAKFYLMLGQLEEREGRTEAASKVYRSGLLRCMTSIPLWLSAVRLEADSSNLAKARALLEQGRLKNPKNDELWLAAVRLEKKAGNDKMADSVLAKALQDCPTSGLLLSESIKMAPRPAQKAKSSDALKKNAADPYILATVGELFWRNRKVENARSWFKRSTTADPKIGDHWAAWYRMELQFGSPEQQQEVIKQCVEAEPNRGEVWNRISKMPRNLHDSFETRLKKVAIEQAAQEKAAGLAVTAGNSQANGAANGKQIQDDDKQMDAD